MAPDPSAPTPPQPGGLLARLKGMLQLSDEGPVNEPKPEDKQAPKPDDAPEPDTDILPTFDFPLPPAAPAEVVAEALPLVEPLEPVIEATPVAEEPAPPAEPAAPPAAPAPPAPCPICGSERVPGHATCPDCGFHFPDDAAAPAPAPLAPAHRVKTRYEVGTLICEHRGVARYRARDLGLGGTDSVPVVLVRQASAAPPPAKEPASDDEDIIPDFDSLPSTDVTEVLRQRPDWPGVLWERYLLDLIEHPGLPALLDTFSEDGFDYLVEEVPAGRSLWDAWDDPEATFADRFGWLAQVAETMQTLHRVGALFEDVRPDILVISDEGRARFTDLSDLLSLPLPPDPPLRGRLYAAPELLASPESADARAGLYSFGAMLYALHVGRELSEIDFNKPGHPKPFIPRFPDVHPAFGRLIHKTFCRQVEGRFPSDEAVKEDHTGFTELIRTLRVCGRTLDSVRLEIGSWTTTGMVRTGNEDAFALLHSVESRQDDVAESALILLADGMGGYEAGEVAAALAIQSLRKYLTAQKAFAALGGSSGFASDQPHAEGNPPTPVNVEELKKVIKQALKEANKHVFTASRSGIGRRGMGCTAEVVYVDGRNVVVGHVGDSRTYHLSEGRLIQMTRDQTLVARLVELGTLSPEEAETHPRRNELQQAVGGQPDVEPGIYAGVLKAGDFIVVCSDGVSNHVTNLMMRQFLQGEAVSAELAARRLVNLVNIEGATDNATVVVVRAT